LILITKKALPGSAKVIISQAKELFETDAAPKSASAFRIKSLHVKVFTHPPTFN
jgi:hypothetical protein